MTRLLSFMALALYFFSFEAGARQITDVTDLVSDKTFWHERLPERYAFGKDGLFLLQYTSGQEQYEAGAVREGAWDIGEGNRLCWMLKDEGIHHCYDIAEDLLAKRPWYNFDNVYELKEAGSPATILWTLWMNGNLIAKSEIYKVVAAGKPTLPDGEVYKTAIGDKIMRLPMGYVYHFTDGRTLWANEEKALKSIGKKTAAEQDSGIKWTVDKGRHCYHSEQSALFCVTVFSAQDLYVPQEGWVQIMDDNFIRLIKPEDLRTVP